MSPRKPKHPSRVFLAKFLGRPWREIEREHRRRERVAKESAAALPDGRGAEPHTDEEER